MYIGLRGSYPIEKGVVHINVGPETHNGAQGLVNYLNNIQGGYHVVVDDVRYVQAAPENCIVYGASGANATGLHLCILGDARQSREQWLDDFSVKAMRIAAGVMSQWCKKYGLPIRRLTPQQVATSGVKGLCGHLDVERSGLPGTGGVSGHYDPGHFFPWDVFLPMVQGNVQNPAPTPHPPEVEEMQVFIDWKHTTNPNRPRTLSLTPGGVAILGNGMKIKGLTVKPWPGKKNLFYADAQWPKTEQHQGADELKDDNGIVMIALADSGEFTTRKVMFVE